ncbi:hypothetical protein C0992_003419 [Termitomyces sp. T32_za158]|nr:hypothetical protein C0992_003419 [Termitomyces sp. T32_za158]
MSTFHDDLELDEALDEIDPLRHLMHQSDDDDDEPKVLVPKQLHSVQGETLHLSFTSLQHPHIKTEIALAVDASPGCGGIAWPAGEVLSSYLVKRGPDFVHGRSILELGSGTGLVGLVAAKLQLQKTAPTRAQTPNVWITDQASLPSSFPMPDLVLAADCVYFEPAFPLLVQTLCDLVDVAGRKEPEVLFCYKKRRKADKRFFSILGKAFIWNEVMDDPDRVTYSREAITLLRLSRRKPSSRPTR